jgi:hypothetical protein
LTDKKAAAGTAQGGPATWSTEDQKTVAEIREKLAQVMRRRANPALGEAARVQITVSADAPLGRRDLRLVAQGGLSTPLAFYIGDLPEFSQKPAEVGEGGNLPASASRNRTNVQPQAAAEVTLPVLVNGQIMPGVADEYHFQAKRGQHLVFAATARELIPYIADAVPGWFQACLTLYDSSGKEVASADHYLFHPDPVLDYEVPSDGQYTLAVRDSIYRGREDFVYRVAMGELPYITGVFPLGGKEGSRTKVALRGWNLPLTELSQRAGRAQTVSLRAGQWTSNTLPFGVDTLREYTAGTASDDKAQPVKPPVVVNGRIERPGQWDVFSFKGRAGEEIVAEVFARRLGSPLDSILKLTDVAGRELASNDDYADKGAGLLTHQADSRISFRLPASGSYRLHISDTEGRGGREYAYRLRVGDAQPDFELRVVPSSINVRNGAGVAITVYALRKDGFSGDIRLSLSDARGLRLDGGVIPAGQDSVRVTLTALQGRRGEPQAIEIEGRATVSGRDLRHQAVPADDMMQAFAYRHLVPADDLLVAVIGGGHAPVQWKDLGDALRIPAGGSAQLRLVAPPRFAGRVQLSLNEPPEGISIQRVSSEADGVLVVLRANAKVKPGLRGNLILDGFAERDVDDNNGKKQKRRQPLGAMPAVPFEIVSAGAKR